MDLKDSYFYIEFEIISLKRFECFKAMFEKLEEVKNDWMQDIEAEEKKRDLDYQDLVIYFDCLSYLNDDAIAHFRDTFDTIVTKAKRIDNFGR